MRPIPPDESLGGKAVVFAEHQPERRRLPARTDGETVVSAWELSAIEKAAVLAGAPIIVQQTIAGHPLQPIGVYVWGCEAETEYE